MRLTELVCLAAENADGADWYDKARADIESVCKAENWNPEYFAGILAVTSPRVSVRRNIRIAIQYCATGRIMSNVMRSIKTSIETWNTDRIIKGRKTEPFYRALMGDDTAIVLDTHMANLLKVPQRLFATKGGNAYYAGIVRGIADILCMSVAGCQAALWYGQMRKGRVRPQYFPILEEYQNWLSQGREFPDAGTVDTIAMPEYDDDQITFDFGANAA